MAFRTLTSLSRQGVRTRAESGPPDFGPYRVHELLGRGGMGVVHRAYDTVVLRALGTVLHNKASALFNLVAAGPLLEQLDGSADGSRGRVEKFAMVIGDRAPDLVARERASGRWPY